MAIQSLTDLKALINSTIQDNTTNDISGSDVQTALINAIDTLDSLEGFINVHKANGQTTITAYGSKALARASVPDDCKKEGVVIAYKISTGWLIEQNLDATAGTWGDDASWQTIGPVSVSQNSQTLEIGGVEQGALGGVYVENPEWAKVLIDNDDKIIEGIKHDGTKVILVPISLPINLQEFSIKKENNPEFVDVEIDADNRIIHGIRKDGTIVNQSQINTDKAIKDIQYKTDILPLYDGDFNESMSMSAIISLYNSKLSSFCSLCRCHTYCMEELSLSDTKEILCEKINHNFRANVVFPEMSKSLFASKLNEYFKKDIFRFKDAKLNVSNSIDFSMRVGSGGTQFEGIGEPSTLISDNGQKIELFSSQGYYTETSDGINWSEPQQLVYHDYTWSAINSHFSVNKVDGKYMMIADVSYGSSRYFDLLISDDAINFYWKGHLFENGVTNTGAGVTSTLGNTYMFKDGNGKYYLIYEAVIPSFSGAWVLCQMSCNDILEEQGGDFVGDWVQCSNNPILHNVGYPCCNPELIKGQDNQPLRVNGNFYMYYLSYVYVSDVRCATIRRAYSADMENWIDEGIVFDDRDTPDGGEANADNGDQSMCEFKGKSYFFYSHNINNYGEGTYPVPMSIRYTIDDRPFLELLKLKP